MRRSAAPGERTLLTGLLLSAPGPAITLFAALSSGSATQLADFLRRTAELVASLVSLLVFRRLSRVGDDGPRRQRLERLADRVVAGAMVCSGMALCVVGVVRLLSQGRGGQSVVGLVTAALGLVANVILWRRYAALAVKTQSPVLAAQQRLYRAKATVDLAVTAALAAGVIAPGHPATRYIDALGSLLVALYLLQSGLSMIKTTHVPHRQEEPSVENQAPRYQIIPAARRTVGHWSGGSTEQLFIWPPRAEYSARNFAFRVSTATVELPRSDFTSLGGITRWIMPLSGQLTLCHPGQEPVTLPPLTAYCFDGGLDTESQGRCTDFNLMLSAGWSGTLSAEAGPHSASPGGFAGAYAYGGPATLMLKGPGGHEEPVALAAGDLLYLHGPGTLTLGAGEAAVAFTARPEA